MPRGYWSVIAQVAGLVLILALTAIVYATLFPPSTALQNEAINRAKVYRENAENRIEWFCSSAIAEPDCVEKTRQAQRENERDEYDLAAQRIMAWWTKVMGVAALIGMGISAVGVWLIKTTFDETRKANKIANKSIDSFRKREVGMLVPKFSFKGDGQNADEFCLELINIGPTNVRIIHKQLHSDRDKIGQNIKAHIDDDGLDRVLIILGEDKYIFPNNSLDDEPELTRLIGGAIYADIFNEIKVCPIAIVVNKFARTFTFDEGVDFSDWHALVKNAQASNK